MSWPEAMSTGYTDAPKDFSEYVVPFVEPRDSWTVLSQGVTHDDTNWYFSTEAGGVFRIAAWEDLEHPGTITRIAHLSIINSDDFHHLGDIDYVAEYNVVLGPIERKEYDGPPAIAAFRFDVEPERALFVSNFPVEQGQHAPWCAVNPVDGLLYSSDAYDDGGPLELKVHELTFDGDVPRLRYLGSRSLFDEQGVPLRVRSVQGGAFSSNGHLYMSIQYKPTPPDLIIPAAFGLKFEWVHAGIMGFNMVSGCRVFDTAVPFRQFSHGNFLEAGFNYVFHDEQELEGLTVWDTESHPGIWDKARGQIHLMMNESDTEIYFKHYTVTDSERSWL